MSARSSVTPPPYLVRLKKALVADLTKLGLKPKFVEVEPVKGTKLYRLLVIAPKFSNLGHFERQDVVWKLVEARLGRDERIHVSTIRTLTPSEASDAA